MEFEEPGEVVTDRLQHCLEFGSQQQFGQTYRLFATLFGIQTFNFGSSNNLEIQPYSDAKEVCQEV